MGIIKNRKAITIILIGFGLAASGFSIDGLSVLSLLLILVGGYMTGFGLTKLK